MGVPSWPATLQAPCIGRKPKAMVVTMRVLVVKISGLPLRNFKRKNHLDVAPWRGTEYIIRGKMVASPSPGRGESCVSKLPMCHNPTFGRIRG
jgi:hypothetical protein